MPSLGWREPQRGNESSEADQGFTLIELLVVLLIIGILLAIAIPTFLSVTKSANNTAAQANLQLALTGAKSFYTNSGQTYQNIESTTAAVSNIQAIDTGLSYISGTSAPNVPHEVSIYVGGAGSYVVLTGWAPSTNLCWGILDIPTPQPGGVQGHAGIGTWFFVEKSQAVSCAASTFGAGGTAVTAQSAIGWPSGT